MDMSAPVRCLYGYDEGEIKSYKEVDDEDDDVASGGCKLHPSGLALDAFDMCLLSQ